ncbi:MAG TPA: ATP-binding protein [Candidatus Colwellbacteria bacterium]|nr:ATP-binding protein [Candidatus Colwellbacteria bacterium]
MNFEIRKAERTKSKLRLAIAGPAGSGKTMGSLRVAKGMGGRVCLIDTERGSGDLYADLFPYDIISLTPPFKPDILIAALHAAEAAGYDTIIVDSLSHFWSDEGGLLDQADKLQQAGKNRFTLWADITPQHRRLVNALLNSPKDIIATMRSKQEYAIEQVDGPNGTKRTEVKKLGLAPVQREGMEYEFTIFFDTDQNHNTKASKDRTNMFANEVFILDESIGARIKKWLETGKLDPRKIRAEIVSQLKDRLEFGMPTNQQDAAEFIRFAIKRLTNLEPTEENYPEILKALSAITDKQAAIDKVYKPADVINPDEIKGPDESKKPEGGEKVGETAKDASQVEGTTNKGISEPAPVAQTAPAPAPAATSQHVA